MTYLPSVIITGGLGQVATALNNHTRAQEFVLTACPHTELDITDDNSITAAITRYRPSIIVNTAAYTAVDRAEQEAEVCMRVNHFGVANLAKACQKNNIFLLHLSTDYIFSGDKTMPYVEDDNAAPVNMYGKSKWLGEEAVREYCANHIILRVSGVFSEYGNNFLKTILRLAREKKPLRLVADQVTCPTYAGDIAAVILDLIKRQQHIGTYHYCNQGPTSWYEFANVILKQAAAYNKIPGVEVNPVTTAEYPTAAKRPLYSALDCSKITRDAGIRLNNWYTGIETIITSITPDT